MLTLSQLSLSTVLQYTISDMSVQLSNHVDATKTFSLQVM